MNTNHFYFRVVIKLTFVLFLMNTIQVRAQDVYKVTTQRLNMRATPSVKGNMIGSLTLGTTVTVESIENGWALLNYEGKKCYVSAKYLLKVENAEAKETGVSDQQVQRVETTQQTETIEAVTVAEQPETVIKEKEKKKLISGSFTLFSGEGKFNERLNACLGWHYITLNGFGFEFITRSTSTTYGNRNFDIGPNYSYKLWENKKNCLYVTGALCLSSRIQGMPDVVVTSSGKTKQETKYKFFLDYVANARVSYELPKFTMSAGFVFWAPDFKFSDGYSSNGFHLSLLFPI